MKKYTTKQAAEILGVCAQRVYAKIEKKHFPNAKKCECGQVYLIPENDLKKELTKRKERVLNEKKTKR